MDLDTLKRMVRNQEAPEIIHSYFMTKGPSLTPPGLEDYRRNLISYAVQFENISLINYLLNIQEFVDVLKGKTCQPLVVATFYRNVSVIELLHKHGARSDVPSPVENIIHLPRGGLVSAMDLAMQYDDIDLVLVLRSTYNEQGHTPLLHLACETKALVCFEHLISEPSANLKCLNSKNQDLLTSACKGGIDFLQLCFEKGMKPVNIQKRKNGLHYLCSVVNTTTKDASYLRFIRKDTPECLELLLNNGLNPLLVDEANQIPLELLVSHISQQARSRMDIVEPYPLKENTEILTKCFSLLLSAMCPEPTKSIVLLRLLQQLQTLIMKITHVASSMDKDIFFLHSSLKLNLEVTKMILESGIDLTGSMFYDSPTDYFFKVPLLIILKEGEKVKDLLPYVREILRLLLAYGWPFMSHYGHRPLAWLAENNPDLGRDILNLCEASASNSEWPKIHALRKKLKLEEIVEDDCEDEKNNVCRSLKSTCKAVIYDTLPSRSAGRYAKQLPIPNQIVEYFCLERL